MNSPVDQIKERLSIEEVVSSYIKLDRVGENFKARCPFHNEKTPSFFISPARSSYYCFGCGAKGDIFTFVEEFEGLDFKGALKLLAAKAGVELESCNKEDQKNQSEKERLLMAMEEATLYFSDNLAKHKEAKEYLVSRGLTEESIKSFRIGYVPLEWRGLYNYLKEKGLPAGRQGFSDVELERAGLVKKSEKGFYDRFRGRIMFPIGDSSGRMIAFSGRIFIDDGKSAKYLNSPDTVLFNKSAVLYGLDRAKDSIRKNNFSILVEGQMDLILSHQAGYKNTIATSGTALSDSTVAKENVISNLGLVRRLTDNIVLAFDADRAGFEASNRAGKIALSLGMDVKVANIPEGVDPADLISKFGVPAWREAIRGSTHLIEFLLNRIIKSSIGDMRKVGREVKEKILPYVDALSSSIEKAHFVKMVHDASSIPIDALEADLKKIEQISKLEKREIEEVLEVENKMRRKDYILQKLLGIIFWQKTLSAQVLDIDKVSNEIKNILGEEVETLLENIKNKKEDLIFEAEVFYGEDLDFKKDVLELLSNLEEEYLKEKLSHKMRELHIAEEHKKQEETPEILKEISDLNNKIQNIKNNRLNKNEKEK